MGKLLHTKRDYFSFWEGTVGKKQKKEEEERINDEEREAGHCEKWRD